MIQLSWLLQPVLSESPIVTHTVTSETAIKSPLKLKLYSVRCCHHLTTKLDANVVLYFIVSDTTQMSSEIRPHGDTIDISRPQTLFERTQPYTLESTCPVTNHLEFNSQSPAESHVDLGRKLCHPAGTNLQNHTKTMVSNSNNYSPNITYYFISPGVSSSLLDHFRLDANILL